VTKEWIEQIAGQIYGAILPLGGTLDRIDRIRFERNLAEKSKMIASTLAEFAAPGQASSTPDPADQGAAQSATQEAPDGRSHPGGSRSRSRTSRSR